MTLNGLGLLILLLPLAAATGWVIGRRNAFLAKPRPVSLNSDYLKGLRHLVNEDADKAIEVFVRLLEVDNETVETHLALGNLFRRQGEVDRALKIHQNLVARPNLAPMHRNQACYELGRDYLRAGVLDRAENLFKDLADQGIFQTRSLEGLVSIYEQERDWQRAIETSRRLESAQGQSLRPVIAQYYCELAEQSRRKKEHEAALSLLRQALAEHPDCVRASLMEGQIEEQNENYKKAQKAYQRVVRQDVEFVGDIIEPLERCFIALGDLPGWHKQLQQLMRHNEGAALRVAMARLLVREGRDREAVDYLSKYLQDHPSWLGFHHLLDLTQGNIGGALSDSIESLRKALQQMIAASPNYLCGNCGFEGPSLHWQCLRCQHWNSLSPVKDLIPSVTSTS